uniref:Putative membrane protein At1g16860 n=1 Tax=Anthurium amnicola TaxID=1678845 RepID=A0A1D1YYS5_9ARAE
MGSRFPSHQLSNGLYVSGRPEQPKEKPVTMSSTAMPYTGGDIKKSGELGKMFDIPMEGSKSRKSGPLVNAPSRTGSFGGAAPHSGPVNANATGRSSYLSGPISSVGVPLSGPSRQKPNSGPLNRHGDPIKKSSGPQSGVVAPMARQNSGPLPPVLPTTGLITSGPISSGPLNSSGAPRKVSGPLDSTGSMKLSMKLHSMSIAHNQAVTKLNQVEEYSFKNNIPRLMFYAVILLFVMGFIAGGFILGAVHNAILLLVVVVLFSFVAALFTWNSCLGRRAITGFIARYPDAELRTAKDGQYVKVSGVVTCGNVPLESSFQKVPRCVYTSTSLYEYRGWDSKAANPTHRRFTWGLRSLERHVVDFYISDFQSGLRALVKTGYGARVTPYVDESIIVDINLNNKDLAPDFLRWLGERNLSSDDRIMRMKEGYIKEGSTVSVMGVVQRNDNVLMIVPPPEPISTGCQWAKCFLPASLDGIVLRCEDTSKIDVVPV